MNRILQFTASFWGLLLILLLINQVPSNLIVIIIGGTLFLFPYGRFIQSNCMKAVMAIILVPLGFLFCLGLLMPKQFIESAAPVVIKIAPNTNFLSLWGLSKSEYTLFQTLNELDIEGDIFYPSTSTTLSIEHFFPVYHQANLPIATYDAIDRWRISKAPGDLHDAQMQYLLFDQQWQAWLTQEEYDTIYNPENYTLIYESPPQDTILYFLFEVQTQ